MQSAAWTASVDLLAAEKNTSVKESGSAHKFKIQHLIFGLSLSSEAIAASTSNIR
ncbi:hypothetical protein J6590_018287 [Homalodisca vitripennis]|nr:hypothetical protein J6590_018287 [Homalodisca vitripennis]